MKILKVCVCSDSHGNAAGMTKMLECEAPDVFIFLGDGVRDLKALKLPSNCRRYAVRGNCDFGADEPEMRLLNLENIRILMVHGHRYAVKSSLLRLSLLAQEHRADVTLYGHTHRQDAQWIDDRLLLCPGSVGSSHGSYAVLSVDHGRFDFVLKGRGALQP